jgi:hypothetical protein
VTQVLARVVAAVVEIALGDNAKGADGGEHPGFGAVDLVHAVAFSHRPPLTAAGQVESIREHISRISISGVLTITRATTTAAVSVAEAIAVTIVQRSRVVPVPHTRSMSPSARDRRDARDDVHEYVKGGATRATDLRVVSGW